MFYKSPSIFGRHFGAFLVNVTNLIDEFEVGDLGDRQNITKNIFLLEKIKIPYFGALKTYFPSSTPNILMKFATVAKHNKKKKL